MSNTTPTTKSAAPTAIRELILDSNLRTVKIPSPGLLTQQFCDDENNERSADSSAEEQIDKRISDCGDG
jgi:hypothetical protein